jgi:hypothetical protein
MPASAKCVSSPHAAGDSCPVASEDPARLEGNLVGHRHLGRVYGRLADHPLVRGGGDEKLGLIFSRQNNVS